MTTKNQSALNDLAFIKALVERGGKTDARGGGLLIGVGLVCGSASLFHWSVQNQIISAPMYFVMGAWVVALFLISIMAAVLNSRAPRRTNPDNVYRSARIGIMSAIVILWLVVSIASVRFRNPEIMELLAPMVFTLAGGFWVIFSSVQERKRLRWVPIGAFLAAIVLAFFLGTPHLYLVNALALVAFFVVPGIVMRQRPSDALAREV